MRSTIIACALSVAVGTGAQAQLGSSSRSETAQRLGAAVAAKQLEQSKTGEQDAARAVLANTAADARVELSKPVDAAEAARDSAAQQRMAQALDGLSPEGKALLAQNDAPLLKVPVAAGPDTAPPVAEGGAPKPKPLKPEVLTEPAPPDTKQTIITGDLTYFDSPNSIAVFVGNVVVDSPQFHITCDEFEVHMRKEAKDDKPGPDGKPGSAKAGDTKGAKGSPPPAKPAPAGPKPDVRSLAVTAPATAPGTGAAKPPVVLHDAANPADPSIENAIAKGRKVVIVKHNPDGKIQIGQSRYAYYDGNTGDVTLRQSPQVQDGDDLHISLEPTTVMILTQNGALHTTGRSTTKLVQAQDSQNGAAPAKAGAPGTAPASGAAKTSKGGLSIPGPVPGQ